LKTECYPISILPHARPLFVDFCESREVLAPFYAATPYDSAWMRTAPPNSDRVRLANLLAAQNTHPNALANIELLRNGAGAIVSGQQVALFGGPSFTPFKAATIIQKSRQAIEAGYPHVPIFWLATEDHDFDEIAHTTFPAGRELRAIRYAGPHVANAPVGNIVLGNEILAAVEQAQELLQPSGMVDLLSECYQPGKTFGSAFRKLLSAMFAEQGLIVMDASIRDFHALGADVLRQAIVRADELHAALIERDQLLASRGYHSQVLVSAESSLLFLVDAKTGARQALKRTKDNWQAGRHSYSADELLAILESEPERLSPNALLRPVFQDAILPTAAYVGGPAEIAYFAQSQVLFEKILGRTTPVLPRLTATLIEPAIAEVMSKHELSVEDVLRNTPDQLAQRLGARTMPVEGKRKLSAAGNALDAELTALTEWMHSLDAGLGRSGDVAASKMRYQMNRLRRLSASFQLQKEASLRRHVDAISTAIYPGGHPQERLIGGVYFFAQYGETLAEELVQQAVQQCPGHKVIYL
jgi:bacillithiol biosynthesis cysteine-adding enzyme BshC